MAKGPTKRDNGTEAKDAASAIDSIFKPRISNREWNKALKELEKLCKKTGKNINDLSKEEHDKLMNEIVDKNREAATKTVQFWKSSFSQLTTAVEGNFNTYSDYFTNIETRLLGTGKTFESVFGRVKDGLNNSSSVSLLKVLGQLNEYVNQGIAYNVEQRAFLQTVSDKIATTFDAANGTLTRLIRINQADTTSAYLGIESILTEFLNNNYYDTSYLTQNLNESVSANLLEATAQLGGAAGAEFELVVQKWLGSFSSLGASNEFINLLSQGLGYLGSGNVNALTSNQQLNNLFATASNWAGLDYGQMLKGGINAWTVNELFKGIVNQFATIAGSSDMVSRNVYAQLFGASLSDLTAVINLTADDIANISSEIQTYTDLTKRTNSELGEIASRTSVKERVDNVLSNIMAGVSERITSNAGAYITYLAGDMLDKIGIGEIDLHYWGLGTTVTIGSMLKAGIAGASLVGEMMGALGNLSNWGKLNLSEFGEDDIKQRGSGLNLTSAATNSAIRTTSQTTYIGNSDSSSLYEASIANERTNAETIQSSGASDDSNDKNSLIMVNTNLEAIIEILDITGVVVRNSPILPGLTQYSEGGGV